MKAPAIILINSIITISLVNCAPIEHGILEHHHENLEHEHERATSYQNLHIEHFYPIPKHFGKEHQHLLEHPISIGKTVSKVEIHHGGKHDHGYAIASVHSDVHDHGHGDFASDAGDYDHHQQEQVHEHQAEEAAEISSYEGHGLENTYQVHDHQQLGQQYQYEVPVHYAHE